jgi:hypothetical protein
MAVFAIGSISKMAEFNPRTQLDGSLTPYLGSKLHITWGYVVALFVCIIGVHAALIAAAVPATAVVVVKDDSYLSIARLLKPLLAGLGKEQGTLSSGKAMSEILYGQVDKLGGVVYGPREAELESSQGGLTSTHDYVLDLGRNVAPRKEWKHRRHPDGRYL